MFPIPFHPTRSKECKGLNLTLNRCTSVYQTGEGDLGWMGSHPIQGVLLLQDTSVIKHKKSMKCKTNTPHQTHCTCIRKISCFARGVFPTLVGGCHCTFILLWRYYQTILIQALSCASSSLESTQQARAVALDCASSKSYPSSVLSLKLPVHVS